MACAASRASRIAALLIATATASTAGHLVPQGELAPESFVPHRHRMSFMRHRSFQRNLRVCNAYPNINPLDVFRGFQAKLTGDEPMPYKSCRDFTMPLKVGDKIRFMLGDHTAGVFVVQSMPPDSSVLLLVIKRHDRVSTAVAFQSHVFTKHANAQIAIINTFQGPAQSNIRMAQVWPQAAVQGEQLRLNSLMAVAQGMYDVNLTKPGGAMLHRRQLVALNRESYVIMVSGFDEEDGNFIPQDLVIYPNSNADLLPKPAGAPAMSWFFGAVVTLFASLAHVDA